MWQLVTNLTFKSNSNEIEINLITYHPKSCGNDVKDISFSPNTVKLFNCENPAGSRGIGFELKSATCRLRKCRMSSGMSGISVKENKGLIVAYK